MIWSTQLVKQPSVLSGYCVMSRKWDIVCCHSKPVLCAVRTKGLLCCHAKRILCDTRANMTSILSR